MSIMPITGFKKHSGAISSERL